ncbi:MAG: two-component system sensor with a ligand-binding domain, partial [Bacteroidota bacterium]|nr:two-component system sensor with a ligand-binding domain [Bacteroidota bacterium]
IQKSAVIYDFLRLDDGRIIAGAYDSCLLFYNMSKNSFEPGVKVPDNIYHAIQDPRGNVWISGFAKLYLIKKGNSDLKDVTGFLHTDLNNIRLRHLEYVNDTAILISSSRGLLILNPANFQIISLQKYWTATKQQVPEIYQCYAKDLNNIWLATNNGLQHLSLKNGVLEVFGKESGLNQLDVVSLLPDEKENLWLGTNKGLSCFIRAKKRVVNFVVENGIPNNEFNYRSQLKLKDGRLLFGTIDGMCLFKPNEVLSPSIISYPLIATRLSVYDGTKKIFATRETGIEHPAKIELLPFDRFFELDVALLNYAEPDGHKFSYYLQNFDDNWIDNGKKSTIRYTSLPAGDYRLHIKAEDQRGIWSEELVIPVIVHEVFYRKIWFWLLCFVIVFILSFFFYRFRINQLQKVHNMRMKIAADLHDEVGSTLTDIAVQAELAQMSNSQQQTASLEKIAKALHNAVGNMRDVIWTVNAKNDTVGKLLSRMEEHLYEALSGQDIQSKFIVTGVNRLKEIDGVTRQNIYLIFKEAITNIIKHSNATKVEVQVTSDGESFELKITDNGNSTQSKFMGNGIGLESMKDRAKELGANIEISRANGFEIILRGKDVF